VLSLPVAVPLTLLTPAAAQAQVLPDTSANRRRGVVGCRQTSSGITCPGGGGSGGGGYGYGGSTQMWMGITQNLMGQFMQGVQRGLEIRRQREQANSFNDQGLGYEKQRNHQAAADYFRRALALWNHPTIHGNLRRVQDELSGAAERRRQAARRQQAQIAAAKRRIKNMIGNLEADLSRESTSSTLDSAGVTFAGPEGTSFFGQGGGGAPVPPERTAEAGDLDFVAPGQSLFEKGSRYSAPVDLRDGGPAFEAPRGSPQEAPVRLASAEAGLDFIAPGQKVSVGPPPPANPQPGFSNGTFARIENARWPKFEKPLLDFEDNLLSKGVAAVGRGYWDRVVETAKRETIELVRLSLPKKGRALFDKARGVKIFKLPDGVKAIRDTLKEAKALRDDLAKPYKRLLDRAMDGAQEGSKMFAEVEYDQKVIDEYRQGWIRDTENTRKTAIGIIEKKAEDKLLGNLGEAGATWHDQAKPEDFDSDMRVIRWVDHADIERSRGGTAALREHMKRDRRPDSSLYKHR
jgi:hypothetical protein